ncbi:MAG: N-acetylmuramic acid 6-phosphate etherase [Bacteroidota bacterium]
MEKLTEKASVHRHLDQKSTKDLLQGINQEDRLVAQAVSQVIPNLIPLVDCIVQHLQNGGRLFYLGAGTSGRLGVLDASECPPTFGVSSDLVVGLIAGGDQALRHPVEYAEDDTQQGWLDLQKYQVDRQDIVVGITASGTTTYVLGALKQCQKAGIVTAAISCNPQSEISRYADFPIEILTGPEFVTGSTRMKAGTAQKLVLNMISTSTMIRLGKVKDNKMVDMQLSNEKLLDRGTKMIIQETGLTYAKAKSHLLRWGSVRKALDHLAG